MENHREKWTAEIIILNTKGKEITKIKRTLDTKEEAEDTAIAMLSCSLIADKETRKKPQKIIKILRA